MVVRTILAVAPLLTPLAALAAHITPLPRSQVFEANRGQADSRVRFLSRGPGYDLLLAPGEAIVRISQKRGGGKHDPAAVRIRFQNANYDAAIDGLEQLASHSNYFIGNDPRRWTTDIPHYGRVRYRGLYPGIDAIYYGNEQRLEYDLVVAPGAKPEQIRVEFDGIRRLRVDAGGDLLLGIPGGEIRQRKPVFYQEIEGRHAVVNGRYVVLDSRHVAFEVSHYDRRQPLVIDPVLVYATYAGGSAEDASDGVVVDTAGNAYVTGYTASSNFPVSGALQPARAGNTDITVMKLSPTGTLIYSTYLGGSGLENDNNIAVDSAGNIYVTGQTGSTNFPTTPGAYKRALAGSNDAFVTKINASGNALVFSTYLGGSGEEYGFGIDTDAAGNVYVGGYTTSANFPLAGAFQTALGGSHDAFLTKLDPSGSTLLYSTYLGGSGDDYPNNISVDPAGNLYVAADTTSSNMPLVSALQSSRAGGFDAYIAIVSPSGSLLFGSYLGGSADDAARDIRVDPSGFIYVTGETASPNFPVVNALQPALAGGVDVFVVKLAPGGTSIIYATYLGGSADDRPNGLRIDSLGNAYLVGRTRSANYPLVNPIQTSLKGIQDAYITKVNSYGTAILFSTFLGGNDIDGGAQIGVDGNAAAVITGRTQSSTGFPVKNAFQAVYGGGTGDAYVAKVATCDTTVSPTSVSFGAAGGSDTLGISAAPECVWIAENSLPWLTITSPSSGSGAAVLQYNVNTNTGASALTGSIRVGGQTVSVTVAGGYPALSSLSPVSGAAASTISVTLTGTNFVSGATVNAGPDITVSNVVVVSASQITATFAIASNAVLGAVGVTVTTPAGTSAAVAFTINPPAPGLVGVSPASGSVGVSVPVTLTGSNFVSGATVTAGTNITVSNLVVVSATQITATFAIAANAAPGTANVTVTTAGGTSPAVSFTINPAQPTLTALNPSSGGAGSTISVTLTGTNFVSGATVSAGPDIAVSNVVVASGSQITATFTIAANAALGAANVTVTTAGGTSAATAFTINPPPPGVSGLSPVSGVAGASVPVTITGTNFVSGATVSAGANITVSNVAVVSATQITATFGITANAAAGTANVTVTTSGGTSPAVVFTINPPPPTFTGIGPTAGAAGSSVPVTLTGTNFVSGATISAGASITVSNIVVVSTTQITATFTIAANASPGAANVTVTTAGGTSAAVPFTINPPGPGLSGVSPSSGVVGATVPVTLTGANFVSGAVVSAGADIAVSNVTVVSATQITATFGIAGNAVPGTANVTVTTSSGTSPAVVFTINPPPPTLTGISPNAAVAGSSVPVTLTGTNFVSGATINAGANITISNVVVASGTQITATFTIPANAPPASASVTVTTSGGVTGAAAFTINPSPPTLNSISPASGAVGSSINVTLTGANFVSGAVVNAGTGVTVSNVFVASGTQITATFSIASNAPLGAGNVTVTTSGGVSGGVTFTVNPPPPALASVSPNSGYTGASVAVTLAGSNFVSPAAVNVPAGISATNINVVSATQITATLLISGNATPGGYNVTVTTAGGTSGAAVFTVLSPAPVLSSVTPGSGVTGTAVSVTLAGAMFDSTASITAPAGVTVSNLLVVSPTQLNATFTIAANAALGAGNVTVTTSGGTSGPATFTVVPPPPGLTAISPNNAAAGATFTATLTGSGFVAGATVNAGAGITVTNVTVVNATKITAMFTVAGGASAGINNVTVTTSGGTSGSQAMTLFNGAVRVNAGGTAYTDSSGRLWSVDTGFANAAGVTNQVSAIFGTSDPQLYQTARFGNPTGTAMQYQVAVPNGSYSVKLKFDEPRMVQSGQRLFNVAINGQTVLSNFDIFAAAGGAFRAIDRMLAANVTNGLLTIQFNPVKGNPRVCAIEILPGPVTLSVSPAANFTLGQGQSQQFTATLSGSTNTTVTWTLNPPVGAISSSGLYTAPATVNATQVIVLTATSAADAAKSISVGFTLIPPGGPASVHVNSGGANYTDPQGVLWGADNGFSGGSVVSTGSAISNTTTAPLYQAARIGTSAGTLTYTFTVPNGPYLLTFKFAELFLSGYGQRVFNVVVNGQTALSNLDIFSEAGATLRAVDFPWASDVTGGQIVIQFVPVTQQPLINALSIGQ